MKTELEPGDIVMLKSSGPMMTVEKIDDEGVHCVYFNPLGVEGLYELEPRFLTFSKNALDGLGD